MIEYVKNWVALQTDNRHVQSWLALKSDTRAVTALEYGLIAALVAGAIVTAVTLLGTNLSAKFNTVAGYVH